MDYQKFTEYVEKGYKLIDPDYLFELECWKAVGMASLSSLLLILLILIVCF